MCEGRVIKGLYTRTTVNDLVEGVCVWAIHYEIIIYNSLKLNLTEKVYSFHI